MGDVSVEAIVVLIACTVNVTNRGASTIQIISASRNHRRKRRENDEKLPRDTKKRDPKGGRKSPPSGRGLKAQHLDGGTEETGSDSDISALILSRIMWLPMSSDSETDLEPELDFESTYSE